MVVTKRSYLLKQIFSFQLQVFFKYVWPLCYHQALKDYSNFSNRRFSWFHSSDWQRKIILQTFFYCFLYLLFHKQLLLLNNIIPRLSLVLQLICCNSKRYGFHFGWCLLIQFLVGALQIWTFVAHFPLPWR